MIPLGASKVGIVTVYFDCKKLKHDSSTNSLIRRYRKMRDTL